MKKPHCLILGLMAVICLSCGEDDDKKKGRPIGAPKVKPPVERNAPSGFISLRLLQETTATQRLIGAVQNYLAPTNDLVGAIERLESIDNRMAELDSRAQESEKVCLNEAATSHTLPAVLPDSNTFNLSLQCQENLDGGNGSANSSQLAFGVTDDAFYLFERTGSFGNAVLATTNMDETRTEFWQLGSTDQNGQNYIHLVAEDDVGMEMTSAGTGAITALDCGLHMKSNDSLIYIEGYDNVNSTCGDELLTICISASDFNEANVADCTTAGLNTFTLTTLTGDLIDDSAATDIITTPITGYIDFTESVYVEDPE